MLKKYVRGTELPEHLTSLYKRFNPSQKQIDAGSNPWTDVHIDDNPKAVILATGVDVAGRLQRIYSTTHTENAKVSKFERVRELLSEWEDIRTQIEKDLNQKTEPIRHECAMIAMLIYETGIRPGSASDTKAKVQAFGATTLQLRHVKPCANGVRLQFVGKKGVKQNVLVTNPYLVRVFMKRKKETTAWTTSLFEVSVNRLRDYFKGLGSGAYTPKDFRTARGTSLALELLSWRKRLPKKASARKRIINEALDKVAAKLGNTRGVAKNSYVDSWVLDRFLPAEK